MPLLNPGRARVPAAVGALVLAFPLAASAEAVGYRFVEMGGVVDDDGFGPALRGSVDFGEVGGSGFYLQGAAYSLSGDDAGVDLDRRVVDAALGYRHAIGDFWALEGELAWRDEKRERAGVDLGDGGGMRLSFGVRGSVSERVELRAMAGAFDAGDRGTEAVGEMGLHVLATQNIGFTTDVLFDDDGTVLRVGVRVRF